jgi:hypothetical protein
MEVLLSLKRQTNPATQQDAACILECLIVADGSELDLNTVTSAE